MAIIDDSVLGTIYEDIADLQTRVTALENLTSVQQTTINAMQTVINGMGAVELEENVDLNVLGVGDYIIPSNTVCATLLNKPIASNATGFIKVIEGGAAGQLMQYYFPCNKDDASYYQRAYYQGAWGSWHDINVFNSDWIDLSLATGISAYSEAQKPRYCRIGNIVFLSGVFTGVTASNTVVATLPVKYRPSKKVIIACASVGQIFSRLTIDTNGIITYNRSTIEPVIAENYHSIACSFYVE